MKTEKRLGSRVRRGGIWHTPIVTRELWCTDGPTFGIPLAYSPARKSSRRRSGEIRLCEDVIEKEKNALRPGLRARI